MKWVVVVCSMLAAACINIHPYDNAAVDAPGGDGAATDAVPPTPGALGTIGDVLAALDGAGGVTVTGPGYVLHFDAQRAHFPDSFKVAGVEVLAEGSGCGQHAGNMGVELFPLADSQLPSPNDSSDIEITTTGPNVARVTINWTVALSCGTAHVDSWWTFFPDGRIARYDAVGGSFAVVTGCGCGAGSSLQLRNVTLYKPGIATSITTPAGGNQIPDGTGNSGNINDRLCIANADFKLLTVDGLGPGPLLYQEPAGVGVVYTLGDPVTSLAGSLGSYYSVIIPMTPATTCSSMQPTADGFAEAVSLHINGDGADTDDYDGTAGGFHPDGSFGYTTDASDIFTFEAKNDSGSTIVPGPPGYSIGMRFSQAYPSYKVERTRASVTTTLDATAARVQQLVGPEAILWLRDGLPYGDVVTVTAQP